MRQKIKVPTLCDITCMIVFCLLGTQFLVQLQVQFRHFLPQRSVPQLLEAVVGNNPKL